MTTSALLPYSPIIPACHPSEKVESADEINDTTSHIYSSDQNQQLSLHCKSAAGACEHAS